MFPRKINEIRVLNGWEALETVKIMRDMSSSDVHSGKVTSMNISSSYLRRKENEKREVTAEKSRPKWYFSIGE